MTEIRDFAGQGSQKGGEGS